MMANAFLKFIQLNYIKTNELLCDFCFCSLGHLLFDIVNY